MTMGPPFMQLWVADYLKDTRGLTTEQHGAYLLLIMEYWTKGSLPDDDKQLARIAGMAIREWRKSKPALQAFFHDGWKHRRIDEELAKAKAKHSLRQEAGKRGAKAKQKAKQKPSNAQASSSDIRQDSDAIAYGADAPSDPRTRLFREGLEMLAEISGRGPDACRSFVGKCLKAADDDAIVVLGLIEDAKRNRVANPTAWIAARLKGEGHGKASGGSLLAAIDKAIERSFAEDAHSATGEDTVLGIPDGPVRRR